MKEEISNSSLNFINPSEIEICNTLVELSRRQTCILYSARWNSRLYVLKTLRDEYATNPVYIEALRKEFELGVRLDHPGIIRVVAFEEIDTLGKCIVMEWVDGQPLNKFLKTNPKRKERRHIAHQIAEALAYMHQSGVAHRDIKPDNIMITRRGHIVKIIDFGLSDADSFTNFKRAQATRSYGAPELHDGTKSISDFKADVYSFGKIMLDLGIGHYNRKLIRRCLSIHPERRPEMSDVAAKFAPKNAISPWVWLIVTSTIAATAIWLITNNNPTKAPSPQPVPPYIVRIDTVYVPMPPVQEEQAPPKTTWLDNTTTEKKADPPLIADSDLTHKVDSIFEVYKSVADDNVANAATKLAQCTDYYTERKLILEELYKHNQNTVQSMEEAVRKEGCSERVINSLKSELWFYITSIMNEFVFK